MCCFSYGSPSSNTLVYQWLSPTMQRAPQWVRDMAHPRPFSSRAPECSPQIRCVKAPSVSSARLTKKKKRETKPGRSAPPATLGQKQQPRSGVTATKGQLVAGGHRALWGDSHAWPNAARLAASVSAPRCLSAGGHRFKVTMSLLFTDYSGIKGIGHHLHVSA